LYLSLKNKHQIYSTIINQKNGPIDLVEPKKSIVMEQPKNKNYKPYLFIFLLLTTFSIMILAIEAGLKSLAIVATITGVFIIGYGLFSVLNVTGK